MVGKNLKYALLLSGVLALTPATVGADTGRKLGGLQAAYVSLTGVQPDQATFGMIVGNAFLKLVLSSIVGGEAFGKLAIKYAARFVNCPDGIAGHAINGTKDALLTGSVEDFIKEFGGTVPTDIKDAKYRYAPNPKLATALKVLSALITAGRSYYMFNKAEQILARVEDECKKLEIESGIKTGLAPEDDGYLVIENPLKTVALGARQAVNGLAPWVEPGYTGCPVRLDGKGGLDAFLPSELLSEDDMKGAWQEFSDAWDANPAFGYFHRKKLLKALNEKAKLNTSSPAFDMISGVLLIPVLLTHFRGRVFIPHTTFKVLPADLQQELLDLVAFNTVRYHS